MTSMRDVVRSRTAPLVLACALTVGCAPAAGLPDGLSDFSMTSPGRARVAENITACVVDAICSLRLEFADTTVRAVYGGGDQDGPPCPIDTSASDAAFSAEVGDIVEVSFMECEELGLTVSQLTGGSSHPSP